MSNHARGRRRSKKGRIIRADWVSDAEAARRAKACACPKVGHIRADGALIVVHYHQHACPELLRLKAAPR